MPSSKIFYIDKIGDVKITKKSGLKRVSMRVLASGQISISMPNYLPYIVGQQFAKSHADWAIKQSKKFIKLNLYNDMPIGKTYRLKTITSSTTKARLVKNSIVLNYKDNLNDPNVIKTAKQAIKRALKKESEQLLPRQVEALANKHNYSYSQVKVKPMKTRWGSCSNKKVITLNTYLMMMPWQIINYVIIHELAHTKNMNHSKQFWLTVEQMEPNYKDIKKQLKELQPSVHSYYV